MVTQSKYITIWWWNRILSQEKVWLICTLRGYNFMTNTFLGSVDWGVVDEWWKVCTWTWPLFPCWRKWSKWRSQPWTTWRKWRARFRPSDPHRRCLWKQCTLSPPNRAAMQKETHLKCMSLSKIRIIEFANEN